jgi:nucleoside-diphosphate-sugar epimerase
VWSGYISSFVVYSFRCHLIDFGEAFPILVQNIAKVKGTWVRVGLSESQSPTYEEIVKASAWAQGYTGEFEYVPAPEGSFYKMVDVETTCDNSLITSLGWKPKFDSRNLISNIPIYLASYLAFSND